MRAQGDVPSVSGTLIGGLLTVAKETLGADVVERGFSNASREARLIVEGAMPGQWIPLDAAEHAFSEIARAAGRDWATLHVELARVSVDRAFKTFWRLLLRFTTDEAIISRTPLFYSKSYNHGRMETRFIRGNMGETAIVEWPGIPDWPIRGSRAGIETVLTAAGRKDVRAEPRRTPDGAVFAVRWK